MTSKWRALFVAACAAQLGLACGDRGGPEAAKSTLVAKVGDRPISQAYFEERLEKMERRFLPDTLDLAGRRKFLDFIVNKELMAMKAEELKYGEDPGLQKHLKTMEDNLTLNTAIEEITKGKLDVKPEEIEAFEEKKKERVLAKHILVRTRAEAEALRKAIEAGAEFDSVAIANTRTPRADPKTQEPMSDAERIVFGEVQYGEAIIPVEEAVFSTPLGQVSQPVETGYGWHLFQPVSVNTVTRSPLDGEGRRRNEIQIQLRRKRTLVEDYYNGIAKKHGFKIDDEALAFIYDNLPIDLMPEEAPDPATESKPVISFSVGDRKRFLFEVDGKQYTIGDFSNQYDETSWFERPKRVTGAMGIRYWVRDRWLRYLQLDEARKKRIHELPAVAGEIKLRREQMMVTMLHSNLVGQSAPDPTADQLREFYDNHPKYYTEKERRRCHIIFNAQERVVQRAYGELQEGKDFVEVAIRYNEGATSPEHVLTQDFSVDTPDFGEIAPQAFALELGKYSEPFKTSQFWVILHLDRITPAGLLPYEDVQERIAEDFKNQWREDKLNELLEQWKANVKVEVYDKALLAAEVRRTDVVVPGAKVAGAGVAP